MPVFIHVYIIYLFIKKNFPFFHVTMYHNRRLPPVCSVALPLSAPTPNL
jgi:hypothetical protein